MENDSGSGPWDLYRRWLSEDGEYELTVSGKPIPKDDDPQFGELGWLIRGYHDTLVNLAAFDPSASEQDNNQILSRRLSQARDLSSVGDVDSDVEGLEFAALCGAIGLWKLDAFLEGLHRGAGPVELVLLWEEVSDAHCEGVGQSLLAHSGDGTFAKSRLARHAATQRHMKSPQSKAKAFIKDCWKQWRDWPSQYSGPTAFARAMLAKFPDELKAETVVMRWVREWDQDVSA